MIFRASGFAFQALPQVGRARRVLLKPSAAYSKPYPATTSNKLLSGIIEGIRKVSDADIVVLESNPDGSSIYPVYRELGYDFPRVVMLDVKDCIWMEVENPLAHAFAVPTFWIPNVVLSSDYLITISPYKVVGGIPCLSIMNLLGLLPVVKYRGSSGQPWENLYSLGMDRVIADLYFTLPFDLGIIEAEQKLVSSGDPSEGKLEYWDKVFVDEPYSADRQAMKESGVVAPYLDLIEIGRKELGLDKP